LRWDGGKKGRVGEKKIRSNIGVGGAERVLPDLIYELGLIGRGCSHPKKNALQKPPQRARKERLPKKGGWSSS